MKPDGRTTCCGAFSTISADDGVEYCKKCYRPVEGYIDEAVEAPRYAVDTKTGKTKRIGL